MEQVGPLAADGAELIHRDPLGKLVRVHRVAEFAERLAEVPGQPERKQPFRLGR